MKIIPTNKRLLVSILDTDAEEDARTFILPETARIPEEFTRAVILSVADDVTAGENLRAGNEIVFPTHLVETVVIGIEEISLVSASHVVCVVRR